MLNLNTVSDLLFKKKIPFFDRVLQSINCPTCRLFWYRLAVSSMMKMVDPETKTIGPRSGKGIVKRFSNQERNILGVCQISFGYYWNANGGGTGSVLYLQYHLCVLEQEFVWKLWKGVQYMCPKWYITTDEVVMYNRRGIPKSMTGEICQTPTSESIDIRCLLCQIQDDRSACISCCDGNGQNHCHLTVQHIAIIRKETMLLLNSSLCQTDCISSLRYCIKCENSHPAAIFAELQHARKESMLMKFNRTILNNNIVAFDVKVYEIFRDKVAFMGMKFSPAIEYLQARKENFNIIYIHLYGENILNKEYTATTLLHKAVNHFPPFELIKYLYFQVHKVKDDLNRSGDGDLLPETQPAPEPSVNVGMDELSNRNRGGQAESEQARDPAPNQCTSSSTSSMGVNPTDHEGEGNVDKTQSSDKENHGDVNPTERKAEGDIYKKLSSDEDNHDDISASSDSDSEPDRGAHLVRQKRKSNRPPVHREEHHVPFTWQFTDDESPYAPGSHASASNISKSTIPSKKSSYNMSAAQNKSQKIRENITDTSSEDSHWSVDVEL